MRYIFFFFLFITSLFAMQEGEMMYASCKFCHGVQAQKIYNDTVPAIKELDTQTLELKLKLYKEGKIDAYGYGAIMQKQMKNIPEDKISILAKYIQNL